MGIGFRKSFLGFNCDDVLKYIENMHKEHSGKEKALNAKYDELMKEHTELSAQLDDLMSEYNHILNQLRTYKEKEADIERLSEDIGKLYLVSKSSAKSIVANATESSKITFEQINKNLDAIDSAQTIFSDAKVKAYNAAQDFSDIIADLTEDLDAAMTKIKNNSDDTEKVAASFDAFMVNK